MARYQVILAYDGTAFLGYQRQKNTRTVQGEVESALRSLGWQGKAILSAGRTDCGVHASGQVIAFDLDWPHSPDELGRALNALLPVDASVQLSRLAPEGFHPRYGATSRTYLYRLYASMDRHPLLERFAWRVWPPVEPGLLEAAATRLVGSHDFVAFGSPPKPGGRTERQVFSAGWTPEDGSLRFMVKANAFLYHMVRRMVFAQVLVGQGKLSLAGLEESIQNGAALPPGLAPAHGLVLASVEYGE